MDELKSKFLRTQDELWGKTDATLMPELQLYQMAYIPTDFPNIKSNPFLKIIRHQF